jgi:deoxyribodipyrimidine photolyase-related protein
MKGRPSPSGDLPSIGRTRRTRDLLVVLGDQLDAEAPALRHLDRRKDALLMLEVRGEAEHVPSHRQRTTLFLSAMRHFALERLAEGLPVAYVRLDERANTQSLESELERILPRLRPARVRVVQPGEHRVEEALHAACRRRGTPLQILPDESFTCSLEEFNNWAEGRKSLVMEHFYRWRRRTLDIMLAPGGGPLGGEWNFDSRNRLSFRKAPKVRPPYRSRPDAVTREVMEEVEKAWPGAYGRMKGFGWPVTRRQAKRALADFIEHRLARFGTYEDAMWTGQPFLYHSALSAALNLKLLRPRECVDAALQALAEGRAEINNVEGFVRQLIGWREFIRGVYYREGPGYVRRNGLEQSGRLPEFFWTGETRMTCLSQCLNQVLDHGYSHHIPRLMVIGNFALTAGVDPAEVQRWFLAMYVDAVEWVTAPNVIGMSQHADGGVVGTKPYVASGKYIRRMSNYCETCAYDPESRTGKDACPFNTLYWDFLLRHRVRFARNHRMSMMLRNLDHIEERERKQIRARARRLRAEFGIQ